LIAEDIENCCKIIKIKAKIEFIITVNCRKKIDIKCHSGTRHSFREFIENYYA